MKVLMMEVPTRERDGSVPFGLLYAASSAHRRGHEVRIVAGRSDVGILILEGEPIGEPVVSYGPFVVNSEQEIADAYNDYNETGFGGWPWDRVDPVHPREKGRFARYADGTVEER